VINIFEGWSIDQFSSEQKAKLKVLAQCYTEALTELREIAGDTGCYLATCASADASGLAALLVQKEIITLEEWTAARIAGLEKAIVEIKDIIAKAEEE
jgi:hypothetical protein